MQRHELSDESLPVNFQVKPHPDRLFPTLNDLEVGTSLPGGWVPHMQRESAVTRGTPEDDDSGPGSRRRRILEHLRQQSERVSESELAARIAADERWERAESGGDHETDADADDEKVRDLQVVLRHVDLPKAAAAGMIEWDAESGTVQPAEVPEVGETEARQLVADGWDDEAAVSQRDLRRTAVAALREAGGELSVGDLATEVAAHETGDDVAPVAADADEVGVALHHRVLPKLEESGLVEYDPEGDTVVYAGPSGAESGGRPGAGRRDRTESSGGDD